MKVLHARNVGTALPLALEYLGQHGVPQETRNGPVLKAPCPVTTAYQRPDERVLLWPERDANPFFHFFEALWMLDGRNDVAFVGHFAKNMYNYSDDGETMHGAYGKRWRMHWAQDQLNWAVALLRENKYDRRVVMSMWDPQVDLGVTGKDVPCNTQVYFAVQDEHLDMTVTCRSNDIVWGCYGANAVHFSMLHEFVARSAGIPLGRYYQMSNDWHAYKDTYEKVKGLSDFAPDPFRTGTYDLYETGAIKPYPMCEKLFDNAWLEELSMFLHDPLAMGFREKFFRKVAKPLWLAHEAYKETARTYRFEEAMARVGECVATDWSYAAREWIHRRHVSWLRAQDDGVSYGA